MNNNKDADYPEIAEAMKEADLLLHGFGLLPVGADKIACCIQHQGKPFDIFGTTLEKPGLYQQGPLKQTAFSFTSETRSIQELRDAGIQGMPI